MDRAKELTHKIFTTNVFSLYLACSRFNGKKTCNNTWHSASWLPLENLWWGDRMELEKGAQDWPTSVGSLPVPLSRREEPRQGRGTNTSSKPHRWAAVPEQHRGDNAAMAKPCLSSNSKAKASRICWIHPNSFPWAFLHFDHNPLSRRNK